MDITSLIMLITEYLGIVAFAISGALVAIDRELDPFGVVIIGCTTAVGGGILRDITLGRVPPSIFMNLPALLTAALTSLFVFILAYIFRNKYLAVKGRVEVVNNIFDALGLSAFAVMGTEVTISAGYGENAVFCVTLGVLTCIGGGIMRDVMTMAKPYVFIKHIYALAALAGSLLYYISVKNDIPVSFATLISMAVVFTIRMLATVFRWSLPRVFSTKTKVQKLITSETDDKNN